MISLNIIVKGNLPAILYQGKPSPDPPKNWKHLGVLGHNIGNNYNSHILNLYKTESGFGYGICRDGCFYQYFGIMDFLEEYPKICNM